MNYFTDAEFVCRCGRPSCPALAKRPSKLLVDSLNALRSDYGSPIIISSGLRCPFYNKQVGGVPDSEHETGEGADLRCPTSDSRWRLLQSAFKTGFRRIGIGKTFLHVGVSHTHDQDVVWTYYE